MIILADFHFCFQHLKPAQHAVRGQHRMLPADTQFGMTTLGFGGSNTSCSKMVKIDGNMRSESEDNLLLPLLKGPDWMFPEQLNICGSSSPIFSRWWWIHSALQPDWGYMTSWELPATPPISTSSPLRLNDWSYRKPGGSSHKKSDLWCSACHVLQSKLRAWRWISTHYYSCFDLNVNQSVFNYHNDELLQVWGKN